MFRDRIGGITLETGWSTLRKYTIVARQRSLAKRSHNCSSQTMSALLCRWLNSDEVNYPLKWSRERWKKLCKWVPFRRDICERYSHTEYWFAAFGRFIVVSRQQIAIVLLKILPCFYQYLKSLACPYHQRKYENRY